MVSAKSTCPARGTTPRPPPPPSSRRLRPVTRLLVVAAEALDRTVGWFRLPTPVGLAVLVGLRSRLRAENLFDTGPHPDGSLPTDGSAAGEHRRARTIDGTYNSLADPRAGSVGCRFGRNVALEYTFPEDSDRILVPNPRVVSRELLTRKRFEPATTLNLLAAAWIQFEVHDWLSHVESDVEPLTVPLADQDPWPAHPMTIPRTPSVPSPEPGGPPTYTTEESHWWDASQIYGSTAKFADVLRTGEKGRVEVDELGLPPLDVEGLLESSSTAANAWVGLALLHSLFMREHNAICERLTRRYPDMSDQRLYDTARLVNSALIAKIHTIDWTPAIIAHPTTVVAMRANWFGLIGERIARRFGRLSGNEVLCGIPGSAVDDHGIPYSLTEEFVAVYRMHPLIPDDLAIRSLADDSVVAEHPLPDLGVAHIRERLAETPMDALFYSFGRANPGALTLHNYPVHLQNLARPGHPLIDLATVDILRVRERGVPRYNEFRRHLRLRPAVSFEELTDNPVWARELERVYGDVEDVDLMIGLYAEPKPPGFGFSDTAFRLFVLMASRRLSADRFFTTDFRPEIYTEAGMSWVRDNTMRSVLLRHFPTLAPALDGVTNPFAPWRTVGSAAGAGKETTAMTDLAASRPTAQSYLRYRDDLEQPRPDEEQDIDKIIAVLRANNERAFRKYKHGVRDAHAKSHGILRGELVVHPDLPPELAQGLFAAPATYPVVARLSSTSGAIRSDQLRGVRGLGIKVLGVDGPRALPGDEATTQDFIMVTHREFLFADAHAYYTRGMPTAWVLARLPDPVLHTASTILSALDAHVLRRIGRPLPPNLGVFVRPNTHILGETFYSSAPLRYGDYIAKILYTPVSPEVRALTGRPVANDAGVNAHQDMVVDFFACHSAEYELRVQLCTDPDTMPIEDATVAWPEARSPHRTVATIRFDVQDPYTPQRRAFGDDVLSFNSWRGLAVHRPLGSINRLKQRVYEASSNYRHHVDNAPRLEPTPDQLPR